MAITMPANVGFGIVRAQWAKGLLQGPATGDGIPNLVTPGALTVTFSPSIKAIVDRTASPNPITIAMYPTVCTVDADGYLINPEDGSKAVKLIATNDADLDPHGDWTYFCTFSGGVAEKFEPFSFTVPVGSDQDIALIAPVPSSTGISLSQAQAAEAAAIAAANNAAASASTASTAATTAVAATATKVDKDAVVVSFKDHGVRGDTVTVTAGAGITSGSATLTVTGAGFSSVDIGKTVAVSGAAASARLLVTTISAVTNSTTVTLAATASTTVAAGQVSWGTDDTAAINAVFAAVTPGQTIVFPPATYLHDHVSITGKTGFTIQGFGATLMATTPTLRYFLIDTCTDFTVMGLTSKSAIKPALLEAQNFPTRAFSIQNCARYTVTGCVARDGEGVGIYNSACTDGTVTNNYVFNTKKDGIHFTSACKNVVVQGNRIDYSGDDAIAVVSYQATGLCDTFAITGNVITRALSAGVANHGSNNVTISGNTINETKSAGIYVDYSAAFDLYGPENTTITGNTVTKANTLERVSNYAGINILGASTTWAVRGVNVSGNTVVDSYWHGVAIGSSTPGVYDVNCTANTIVRSGGNGIFVQAVTNLKLKGNVVRTAVSSGIWGTSATLGLVTIQDNDVIDPCTDIANTIGINLPLTAITRGVITGNSLYDTIGHATTPIAFTGIGPSTIHGNSVGGNSTGSPASPDSWVGPRNALMAGALPSNGAGGGVGIIGVRNATTVPASNPGSGYVLYSENGVPKVRTAVGTARRFVGDRRTVTANYTVLDADSTIFSNGSGVTVTIPAASTATGDVRIANIHASASCTVASAGGTINGASTFVLAAGDSAIFESTGTNWVIF